MGKGKGGSELQSVFCVQECHFDLSLNIVNEMAV
jgi:hypothetical protein